MKIAYHGWFLREGFAEAGCEIIPLQLDAAKTLNALVEETGTTPDFVFLELFGKTHLPREIHDSRHKLVAYCIDSPLNEYWLIALTRLFDAVYVDQLSSVPRFRTGGVPAKWLPLCASEHDFRPATEKKHCITFVGRMTPHRIKRNNLIAYIQDNFPINIVQDVSRAAMLDAFASSKIVLNENFFSGLNLRFFQALASGSLLLTERRGYGVNRHFQEGRHYLGYGPDDLLAVIKRVEDAYETFAPVAALGQETCRAHHTSAIRARTVLDDLTALTPRAGIALPERKVCEAQGKYAHAMRFGGFFNESITLLKDAQAGSDALASQACCILGSIHIRLGNTATGMAWLEKSATFATAEGLNAVLKLMLCAVDDERFLRYLAALVSLIPQLGISIKKYVPHITILKNTSDRHYPCCMLAYALLSDLKKEVALGLHKQYKECIPDYALEYAILAFSRQKTAQSLDAIISCTQNAGIAPEALYYIKQAIAEGVASDDQIVLSATLGHQYYDFAYARTALNALKTRLR